MIDKAREHLGYAPGSRSSTKASADRCSGITENREADERMKVSVVGIGYVGLVTGACLAETGHDVTCVDVDGDKVAASWAAARRSTRRGSRSSCGATSAAPFARRPTAAAVTGRELTLIAVGTPFDGDGIDLTASCGPPRSSRRGAARQGRLPRRRGQEHGRPRARPRRSCVPLLEEASGKRAGDDFGVGTNPEFLTEGQAVDDFMHPDRIVLGGIDERTLTSSRSSTTGSPACRVLRTNTPRPR